MDGSCLSGLGKLLILAALSVVIPEGIGADKPDFSGSYTLTGTKGRSKTKRATASLLQVVQTGVEIEVSRTFDGKAYLNRFKLDGTEAEYRSEGGVQGTSTARFKGKALIIDTQVTTRPQANGPAVQIHTKEQWTLSSDSKTLTIRSDVDFPNSGLGGFQIVEPWSEIYTRNQSPIAAPSQTQAHKESEPLNLTLQNRAWVLRMAALGRIGPCLWRLPFCRSRPPLLIVSEILPLRREAELRLPYVDRWSWHGDADNHSK
jgi:hypothetical protein